VKIIEDIKKVALGLFIITGAIQITAGLMLGNNYLLPYSYIINRSFDIPFAMTGIVYAFTTLYSGINDKLKKTAGILLVTFSILLFAGLLYINLLVPDKISLTSL
jgi:hypothetical protein